VSNEPVLVQISAAKRLRDRAERDARKANEARITVARVSRSRDSMRQGEPA
jgi:chlorophyllide a reductase subunit Z